LTKPLSGAHLKPLIQKILWWSTGQTEL